MAQNIGTNVCENGASTWCWTRWTPRHCVVPCNHYNGDLSSKRPWPWPGRSPQSALWHSELSQHDVYLHMSSGVRPSPHKEPRMQGWGQGPLSVISLYIEAGPHTLTLSSRFSCSLHNVFLTRNDVRRAAGLWCQHSAMIRDIARRYWNTQKHPINIPDIHTSYTMKILYSAQMLVCENGIGNISATHRYL